MTDLIPIQLAKAQLLTGEGMARGPTQDPSLALGTAGEEFQGQAKAMDIVQHPPVPGEDAVGARVQILPGRELAGLFRPAILDHPIPTAQGPAAPADPVTGLQDPYPTARQVQLISGDQTSDAGP